MDVTLVYPAYGRGGKGLPLNGWCVLVVVLYQALEGMGRSIQGIKRVNKVQCTHPRHHDSPEPFGFGESAL